MGKHSRPPSGEAAQVRTRRAYFDCRHGQLHVRTAFPATGGFDEQVTLFCLHDAGGTSRDFAQFLPAIALARSVYAADLPGSGESDPAPGDGATEMAAALVDLAADLRLRQIDLLGVGFGARVALALASDSPERVRRLVLLGLPPEEGLPVVRQPALVLQPQLGHAAATPWIRSVLPNARLMELTVYAANPFAGAPTALAAQVGGFLDEPR